LKCKGRIHSKNDHIVKEIAHNHVSNCGKIEAAKAVNLIKNIAIQNVELSTCAVISSTSITLISAAAGQMPPVSVLKRTIRLIRQKVQAAPSNPKTLIELVILEDYKTTW
ncbi:uncharacterized protein LOC112682483, partial [Sipha flava]|uniref:Uncharacterized protein LOC112682483 n=1 Tax=Sipha flava TaxID=143950 RepID=A0A8B8FE77_9HEMI